MLSGNTNYEALCLSEIAPEDRYQRRHWMDILELSFRTMVYRCPYENHLGAVCFIWKLSGVDLDQTAVSRLISKLNESQKFYSSREVRKEFLDRYYWLAKTSKSVLRNVYKSLTGDCSAATSEAEKATDERVAEALFQLDDAEIIYDL